MSNITSWDPFVQMRNAMNSLDNWMPNSLNTVFDNDYEIYEEGNQLILKINVPGFKKEDVKVEFEDGVITVSAEMKSEDEQKDGKTYYKQSTRKSFSRSFKLPVKVNDELVEAKLENGVLQVAFQKEEVRSKGTIEIK